jgi:spore maturation protein CgeB
MRRMNFVLFYHSLLSDWNHGNAHFLRGVVAELTSRGHDVRVYEPADGWSLTNLLNEQGSGVLEQLSEHYPGLASQFYRLDALDLSRALDGADVVIVHEWNDAKLIQRIGEKARRLPCRVLFHDTHHRSVTQPLAMKSLDLRYYDGVLAFGRTIADRYIKHGWAKLAWVWHEAADTLRFFPQSSEHKSGDVVWIGNWGDEERSAELHEFLIEPIKALKLKARIHGVRYPQAALQALAGANIEYGGWIPNYRAPQVFGQYRLTVHVPRRAYAESLVGVPTIRMFEALSCGIPLISAPWNDTERLFRPGIDYLVAHDGNEMRSAMQAVLSDAELARRLAASGLETIRNHHTCKHRVDELLRILSGLDAADRHSPNVYAAGA